MPIQELLDCLKSELTGNFEMVVVGLMMPAPVYDAYELRNAIKVSEDWEMCDAKPVSYGIFIFHMRAFLLECARPSSVKSFQLFYTVAERAQCSATSENTCK